MEPRRIKTIFIKSLALLALLAVLAGCEITAKTANPAPVALGDQLTFEIDVLFEEFLPGTGIPEPVIFIEDELPANVEFVSASPECEFIAAENTVECEVVNPSGTVGATASVEIVVTPKECGTFTNTAVIPEFNQMPLEEQQAATEQLSAEQQQTAAELLEQLPMEDLITAQQIDEESVDFTVVGCEQPEPEPEPQPAGAAPIIQEFDQESEAGEVDQSFEVS